MKHWLKHWLKPLKPLVNWLALLFERQLSQGSWVQPLLWLFIALLTSGLILGLHASPGLTKSDPTLPDPKVHPLPATLAQWQAGKQQGDYFDQVAMPAVGALVWSKLPVLVYVQPPQEEGDPKGMAWRAAVIQSVQEWNTYLPLQWVDDPDQADIIIRRSLLPLQLKPTGPDQQPSHLSIERARSAEARYELYIRRSANAPPTLIHRFYITLSPRQGIEATQAAARHEMGHALGIWGHSLDKGDVLYFSQVRNPPAISPRDINTLKRIYQQPTRLGWPMPPTTDSGERLPMTNLPIPKTNHY